MTVGEMLADQEIAERTSPQGRAVPVTMTDYRQNTNSGVSQAAYEMPPQNYGNPGAYEAQRPVPPQLAASAQAHSQVSFQETPAPNPESATEAAEDDQ